MKLPRRKFLHLAAGTAALPVIARIAKAATYPSRPIHFIFPFPPGPTDTVIRLYAQQLSQDWGRPGIVDPRPGATGTIGTEAVVNATADGYTLLFTVDLPITMAPNILKVHYDPLHDLIPIAAVVETTQVLVVNVASGIQSLPEFVAAAKAKPGVLTFSSAGLGSPAHFCGEMIKQQSGIDMLHVPYKGAGPAMTAVLAGDVTAFCGAIAQVLPFIQAGKVHALGVAGPAESPLLPGVAPLSKSYPGLVMSNWFGLLAPAKTPASVCNQLEAEFKKISDDADTQRKISALGMEPAWMPGADLAKRIAVDLVKWHNLMVAANIKPE